MICGVYNAGACYFQEYYDRDLHFSNCAARGDMPLSIRRSVVSQKLHHDILMERVFLIDIANLKQMQLGKGN